jgi:hypothetical protein
MNENSFEVINSPYGDVVKMTTPEGQVSWIPTDQTNSDYQAYLASLESAD